MSNKPKWRSDEDEIAAEKDLLLYGNAFVHIGNFNGEIIMRRLDPETVIEKPVADDSITS